MRQLLAEVVERFPSEAQMAAGSGLVRCHQAALAGEV
jgi:hypothetical protein